MVQFVRAVRRGAIFAVALFSFLASFTMAPTTTDAQPSRTDCAAAVFTYDPTNQKSVSAIIACYGADAPSILARLNVASSEKRSERAKAAVGTDPVVARTLNGRLVDLNEFTALSTAKPELSDSSTEVRASQLLSAYRASQKLEQDQNATLSAFNQSNAALAGAQNETARQARRQLTGLCAFKNNTTSAAVGIASLGQSGAVYTRAQLGILSLLVPIMFSHCDGVIPPDKPVPSLSSPTVKVQATIELAVSEPNYTGTFTATANAQNIVTIALKPAAQGQPAQTSNSTTFTITGLAPGTTTITVADDHGQSAIVGVTVTP